MNIRISCKSIDRVALLFLNRPIVLFLNVACVLRINDFCKLAPSVFGGINCIAETCSNRLAAIFRFCELTFWKRISLTKYRCNAIAQSTITINKECTKVHQCPNIDDTSKQRNQLVAKPRNSKKPATEYPFTSPKELDEWLPNTIARVWINTTRMNEQSKKIEVGT